MISLPSSQRLHLTSSDWDTADRVIAQHRTAIPPTRATRRREEKIAVKAIQGLPPLLLSRWQYEVFTDPHRFRVKVCGRRSGKTFEDAVELVRAAVNKREQVCWYVAPIYSTCRDVMWPQLKKIVPREYLRRNPLESNLTLEFLNGSIIKLKSAEDPDSLRGPGLDYLSMDEFAFIQKRAWYEVLSPMIADRLGRATFSTTPAGLNWAYDMFLEEADDEEWKSFTVTTLQGGRVTAAEVNKQRARLSKRTFMQEFEASFEAVGNRVYDTFDAKGKSGLAHVSDEIVDNEQETLLVGMDFNVNPMSLVLGRAVGNQLHVFEAVEIDTSNTTEVAKYLRERWPDREIVCCPDPSGKARKTSAAGATDFTILRDHNIDIDAPNAAPPVRDRINAVNGLLENANGERNAFFHPQVMKTLGRSLNGLTYKEDTNIPDPKGGLVHITDAFGYLVWQRFNNISEDWQQVTTRFT